MQNQTLNMTPTVLLSLLTVLQDHSCKSRENLCSTVASLYPQSSIDSKHLAALKKTAKEQCQHVLASCSFTALSFLLGESFLHNQLALRQRFDNENPLLQIWLQMTRYARAPCRPIMHAGGLLWSETSVTSTASQLRLIKGEI